MSRATRLLPTSKQRTGKLTDKVIGAASVTTLLVVAHKRVHGKTLSLSLAYASLIDAQCLIPPVRQPDQSIRHVRQCLLCRHQLQGLGCLLAYCMGSHLVRACCDLSYRQLALRWSEDPIVRRRC